MPSLLCFHSLCRPVQYICFVWIPNRRGEWLCNIPPAATHYKINRQNSQERISKQTSLFHCFISVLQGILSRQHVELWLISRCTTMGKSHRQTWSKRAPTRGTQTIFDYHYPPKNKQSPFILIGFSMIGDMTFTIVHFKFTGYKKVNLFNKTTRLWQFTITLQEPTPLHARVRFETLLIQNIKIPSIGYNLQVPPDSCRCLRAKMMKLKVIRFIELL